MEAEKSAYYVGVAYQWAGKAKEAREAYESFLKEYPASGYVAVVRSYHLAQLEGAPQGATSRPYRSMNPKVAPESMGN